MVAAPFQHQEANSNKGVLGSPRQVLTKKILITHRVLSKQGLEEWVFA